MTIKKLVKALKEAANVKGTHPTATNAFVAAATMFDILAELDGKFSKVCEREYEGLSQELKKWFKKLTKEEKNHDEYAYAVQSRLKIAAQGYEKKSKPRYQEAILDHTRYMNQLNSLTKELSDARQAHAAYIHQKHTSILFFAGATATRWSDAEWTRSCEVLRKVGGVIGKVGEWRAHCEGGWTGEMPGDLVDLGPNAEQKLADPGRLETLHEDTDAVQHEQMGGSVTNSSAPNRADLALSGSPTHSYNQEALWPPRTLPKSPSSHSPTVASTLSLPPWSSEATSPAHSGAVTPVYSPMVKFADATSPVASSAGIRLDSAVQATYPFPEVMDVKDKGEGPTVTQRGSPSAQASELKSEQNLVDIEQPEGPPPTIPSQRPSLPPTTLSRESASADPSPPDEEIRNPLVAPTRDDEAMTSPRSLLPSPSLPERTKPLGRRSSIESNMSHGSYVAAMRQKYGPGSISQTLPTSPPPRGSPRMSAMPSTSSPRSPRTLSSAAVSPPSSRLNGTQTTDRQVPRHKSFDFNNERSWDRDRPRDHAAISDSPSPARNRDQPLGLHSSRRSRDLAEEQEILEDRDREGSRRRREESFEWEEKELTLKARQRELERMAFELEREKDRLRLDKGYGSDMDDSGGGRERPRDAGRERGWDTEAESPGQRSVARRNVAAAYVSPSPRRTYPLSSALGRQDTPLDVGKPSSSSSHASSCGCHDCSAKLYSAPRSSGGAPPSSISASSDREQDRDRHVAPSERYSTSQTSLTSLSKHAAPSSPLVGKRPSGSHNSSLSLPLQDFASVPEVKTGKRGVFANLRRLSMPLGGQSSNDGSGKSQHSPEGFDDRMASSLGANAARR
ncbi:hypothetical protein FRB96_004899 [Tulasnella sp. 330]|nr:hypothetical protein FRB96_004899 [Tulasnella sp. 330]